MSKDVSHTQTAIPDSKPVWRGKGSGHRPTLISKEEASLADDLWREKDPDKKDIIRAKLETLKNERLGVVSEDG